MNTRHGERSTRVRYYQTLLLEELLTSITEKTRYTNPLKAKFRAKRLAAESTCPCLVMSSCTNLAPSRWCSRCSWTKAPCCTDAGRISSPEQDSVPPKFTRNSHERTTRRLILSVASFVYLYLWQLLTDHFRYPNLYEVRLIPTKKDIAFVEFMDEGSAGVAKDALHNYKLDGENKIKVRVLIFTSLIHANLRFLRLRLRGSRHAACLYFVFCISCSIIGPHNAFALLENGIEAIVPNFGLFL